MKKIAMCLLAACLSLTFLPLQANAATNVTATTIPAPVTNSAQAAEANTLELRLTEINAMDKANMKSSEKKSLRKEVKSINHKLREIGGGVYLSAGGLILILLLLIILL